MGADGCPNRRAQAPSHLAHQGNGRTRFSLVKGFLEAYNRYHSVRQGKDLPFPLADTPVSAAVTRIALREKPVVGPNQISGANPPVPLCHSETR